MATLLSLLLSAGCTSCQKKEPEQAAEEASLQRAIEEGDLETARRTLEAGGGKTPLRLRFQPGTPPKDEAVLDWMSSYLKYHQLLMVRLYTYDDAMCPKGTEELLRQAPEQLRKLRDNPRAFLDRGAEELGSVTPLHLASFFCRDAIAGLLLEHGADPAARDGAGLTPLHWATCEPVARRLLDAGAAVDATSKTGLTPLHLAVDRPLARLLLSRGARLDARDRCGNRPLHMAGASGLRFSSPPGPSSGSTAAAPGEAPAWVRLLAHAIEGLEKLTARLRERFDVYNELLSLGADASATNEAGRTPDNVSSSFSGDD
jgi:hypothetical protein